jgi:RimJ/RimL family protein N-acetyltransferase
MVKALLRPITPEDDSRISLWLSDNEIRRLNPSVGKVSNYKEYAIEVIGTHIGFCGIYNVTQDEAEVGISIGRKDYWGKGYGGDVVNQLTEFCFNSLGVRRVYLKVLHSNLRAIKCYEKCGFTRYGNMAVDGHSFILMERLCSQKIGGLNRW